MAHTTAPWSVMGLSIVTKSTAKRGSLVIARVVPATETDAVSGPEQEDANAHLLAASPLLLAACKFAHSVITTNGVFEMSERLAIERLEAAIALAEPRPAPGGGGK